MPSRSVSQRREALHLLGLQDPVEPAEVVRAYRRLAGQHHPDRGGDPDAFRSLTVARDLLLAEARTSARSSPAAGATRVVTARQRPGRRLVRGLRRRLRRKGGERRDLR